MEDQVKMNLHEVIEMTAGEKVKTLIAERIGNSNTAKRIVPEGKAATVVVIIEYAEKDA
ncbi:MAG: hypothetical protein GY833_16610 [Aestuariibacter sp.]|nr:hypothetical protein [Aestuariibacter sp.]